ncbi:MAG: iron ABC transporter permease [Gemmatimonadales bacterium]
MKWVWLGVIAVVALALAVLAGPAGLWPNATIVRDLRLPRALLAFAVGGGLAITGAALQALIRNPLADPYLLGLSGGAGLGAVLAITLGVTGTWVLPVAAAVGAMAAVWLAYRLAVAASGLLDTRILLLAGVVVSAFATAIVGALLAVSPMAELRSAFLWMLGGFDASSWRALAVFGLYAVLPMLVLFASARDLDLLSLGEEPALFLGAEIEPLKRRLILAATVLTAAAVAVAGMIGFVGLVVPHAIRIVSGHAHRTLLPASFLLGGTLLVLADLIARTVVAPIALPVGVVTALVGVPVFAVLIRRQAT